MRRERERDVGVPCTFAIRTLSNPLSVYQALETPFSNFLVFLSMSIQDKSHPKCPRTKYEPSERYCKRPIHPEVRPDDFSTRVCLPVEKGYSKERLEID
jgi:hypothetical protein